MTFWTEPLDGDPPPGLYDLVYTFVTVAATTTVRIRRETRDALARLSELEGRSTADVLADMVERREEDDLLTRMNDSYAAQTSDPSAREAEATERALWEGTLLDGLSGL